MGRFKDKVVIITGAAGGMGAVEARSFAEEGASVFLADIREEPLAEVTKAIVDAGLTASYGVLDVASEEQWAATIRQVTDAYGRINVLVNNAGIPGSAVEWKDATFAEFNRIMSVNLSSQYLGMQAVRPHMELAGGGAIVNISSIAGFIAFPSAQPAYTASKGGSRLLTKSAAIDFAKYGIRVNSVHPGLIDTVSGTDLTPEKAARLAEYKEVMEAVIATKIPFGRMGNPIEVARAVLFLASDEASYITGTELIIDGGMTAI